jgi:multimeric flavodoxin WrbA
MKTLILDGSPASDARTSAAADALVTRFEATGADVERVIVRDIKVHACTGCFGCWLKTPGQCVIDDDARIVADRIINSDLFVAVTPVSFGGYGSLMKRLIDRQICLVLPYFEMFDGEVHHRLRYSRYPKWLALGTLPESRPDEEATFKQLVLRNANNIHDPGHAAQIVVGDESPNGPIDRLFIEAGIPTEVLA